MICRCSYVDNWYTSGDKLHSVIYMNHIIMLGANNQSTEYQGKCYVSFINKMKCNDTYSAAGNWKRHVDID